MIFQRFDSCPKTIMVLALINPLYLNNIRFPTMGPYKQLIFSFNFRRLSSTLRIAALSLACATCASALIKMVTLIWVLGVANSPHSFERSSKTKFRTSSRLRTRLDSILTCTSRTTSVLTMSLTSEWSLKFVTK